MAVCVSVYTYIYVCVCASTLGAIMRLCWNENVQSFADEKKSAVTIVSRHKHIRVDKHAYNGDVITRAPAAERASVKAFHKR